MPVCATCGGERTVKNGHIHNGKQRYLCQDCGRQFVQDPQNQPISQETKALIDRMLAERMALAAICRVVGVSEAWLQGYVNIRYRQTPRRVEPEAEGKKGVGTRS